MRDDLLDFDDIDAWGPKLAEALKDQVSDATGALVAARSPEYIEDAWNIIFEVADRNAVIETALAWIRSSKVAAYHGTRLTDFEVASVRALGLLPLKAEARRERLLRALSPHPRWREIVGPLDGVIHAYGSGEEAGRREGQVHLTLSRSGRTKGFNHYLTHGAEFDRHVAPALLGLEGEDLLAREGSPRLVRITVPGHEALTAAHPQFSIADVRANGSLPNIVHEFINGWSFRLAHPGFQASTLKVDSGMVFRTSPCNALLSLTDITNTLSAIIFHQCVGKARDLIRRKILRQQVPTGLSDRRIWKPISVRIGI